MSRWMSARESKSAATTMGVHIVVREVIFIAANAGCFPAGTVTTGKHISITTISGVKAAGCGGAL
jgi:hypothetical protein